VPPEIHLLWLHFKMVAADGNGWCSAGTNVLMASEEGKNLIPPRDDWLSIGRSFGRGKIQ
jgi:hypothetical protein